MKRSALVSESLKMELAFSYNLIVARKDGEVVDAFPFGQLGLQIDITFVAKRKGRTIPPIRRPGVLPAAQLQR